ncbi:MAG: FkbM family methyltransferase [Pseudomonadota bacterium]
MSEASATPAQQITLEQYEQLNPSVPVRVGDKTIIYNTPNRGAVWRVQTLFEKEPDTIAWLNGFAAGSVLYDVGANVGMYSIYAAAVRGVRVFAFEPESQNYALLNKNIFTNQLSGSVQAYPVALSDATSFDRLYLSQFMPGGSCHNFGESLDFDGKPFTAGFAQGCFAIPLDELVDAHGLPLPDHIKIDVDGIEHKVIAGARRTLQRPEVKSVLIEINTNRDDHRETVDLMGRLGFRWSQEQVEQAQRKDGAFKGVGNYIFLRG